VDGVGNTSHISPVVLRREIGRRLRLARHEADMTLADAAERLEVAVSSLCRFESGVGPATVHLVRSMMDVYDTRLDDVLDMIRQARAPGWWKQYGMSDKGFVALETGACRSSNYELTFVPGLLQTSDYARALFNSGRAERSAEWMGRHLTVRMSRQDRLIDEDHPLQLDAVVHEFALRQPVGGPTVMRNQLEHLALVNELPTVTLRVLPACVVSNEALYGGFSILDFPNPGQPSIACAQHALGDERQDKSEHVEPARIRFAHLRSLALEPEESVALIDKVVAELWSS
jgi:transcriptional regulator with XRE-family HTH domain